MRGRHRRPRPVRDFLMGLWVLWCLQRYSGRRARRVTPVEIRHVGLTLADAVAAATTTYEVVEPCPWGLSAGACAMWHPWNHTLEEIA